MRNLFPWPAAGLAGLAALSAPAAAVAQATVAPPPVIMLSPPVVTAPRVAPELSEAQISQLLAMLDNAAAHGLTRQQQAEATARRETLAGDRQALVAAVMDHARALRSGRLQAGDFEKDWGLRPVAFDPWPGFVAAVRADRLAAWIAALPPPYTGYDALRRGLVTYRAIAEKGGWPTMPAGPDLTLGARGDRVLALRRRLAVEDPDVDADGPATFDAALLDQVRRAQKRYGLNPTGVVSTGTLAALNVSADERVRQIMANMERWRWLPPELPKDRVQVNIAAAVLTVFEGDAPVTSMRAVTGRPGDETPMLQSAIHSIVLNPPWNVPTSIATRELWPKERSNPGYLRRQGFKVIATEGGGKRLQQRAGPQSALGRVKFDFDNPYAVYLHDTPAQATFDRYSRLASHGCVRLQRPVELAELVLRDHPEWGGGAVQEAIAKGDTVRARLEAPVSVYLLYWTAFASADGRMNFRADPYSWDTALATKIEANARRVAFAAR